MHWTDQTAGKGKLSDPLEPRNQNLGKSQKKRADSGLMMKRLKPGLIQGPLTTP